MRFPSGDHWTSDPCTSARGCEPSAFIIQMEVSHLSFILSTHRRPKMILVPSGDGCGVWTSSQSRYCSSAIRFCGRCWATIGVVAKTAMDIVARATLKARICMGVSCGGRSTCILGRCHPDGKGTTQRELGTTGLHPIEFAMQSPVEWRP